MPVKIGNKEYKTVAERVRSAHEAEDAVQSIITDMLHYGDKIVFRAVVTLTSGKTFTGHAEQSPQDRGIAGQSPVEVCETSAIGRALGIAGFGDPDSIASGDEIAAAVRKQAAPAPEPPKPARPDLERVRALFAALHVSPERQAKTLGEMGCERLEELTTAQAAQLIERMDKALKAKQAATPTADAA